jgi:uncharacterized protein (DUF2062 family)
MESIVVRRGLLGAAFGLAFALVSRFIFGELVSVGDLIVAPVVIGAMMAGTVWLHLIAAEGDWRPTRWAAPAGLEFVGGALMWGNGFGSIPFGVVGGLAVAAFAVWYVARVATQRRSGRS